MRDRLHFCLGNGRMCGWCGDPSPSAVYVVEDVEAAHHALGGPACFVPRGFALAGGGVQGLDPGASCSAGPCAAELLPHTIHGVTHMPCSIAPSGLDADHHIHLLGVHGVILCSYH